MTTQPDRRRRGAIRSIAIVLLVSALALLAAACSDDDDPETPESTPRPTAAPTSSIPGAALEAKLTGLLTLDGSPLEADFLGVRVVRDGLVTACQNQIPVVPIGYYDITVAADAEVRGCGIDGAALLFWTFVGDAYLFSTETVPWPGDGAAATFDGEFSSADPAGASQPVTEFKGELFGSDGAPLPAGTVVEAFIGGVLCGVTSLRHGDTSEGLYALMVVGPESVPGCDTGAVITFTLDGQPAAETAVNDFGNGATGHELNLTLQ